MTEPPTPFGAGATARDCVGLHRLPAVEEDGGHSADSGALLQEPLLGAHGTVEGRRTGEMNVNAGTEAPTPEPALATSSEAFTAGLAVPRPSTGPVCLSTQPRLPLGGGADEVTVVRILPLVALHPSHAESSGAAKDGADAGASTGAVGGKPPSAGASGVASASEEGASSTSAVNLPLDVAVADASGERALVLCGEQLALGEDFFVWPL